MVLDLTVAGGGLPGGGLPGGGGLLAEGWWVECWRPAETVRNGRPDVARSRTGANRDIRLTWFGLADGLQTDRHASGN